VSLARRGARSTLTPCRRGAARDDGRLHKVPFAPSLRGRDPNRTIQSLSALARLQSCRHGQNWLRSHPKAPAGLVRERLDLLHCQVRVRGRSQQSLPNARRRRCKSLPSEAPPFGRPRVGSPPIPGIVICEIDDVDGAPDYHRAYSLLAVTWAVLWQNCWAKVGKVGLQTFAHLTKKG